MLGLWDRAEGSFFFLKKNIYLATPQGIWDLSSPEIESVPPAVEAQSPNHWTTREFP